MILVFWQGIISIHQQTFLEAVAAEAGITKVVLVVAEHITAYRKDMGWDVPELAGVELIVAPPRQQVKEIVQTYKDAVHIMGGVRVGPMLKTAFDHCVKEHCRIGIMTEPYNDAGIKGRLRTAKYKYYKLQYFRYVQFVLAIGKQGVKQYARLGFDTRRIFPWAYFIDIPAAAKVAGSPRLKRLIYAGRLEAAKGIYAFADVLMKTGSDTYTLDIYGAGTDEEKLRQLVAINKLEERVRFHPFLKHSELVAEYGKYDWVVLPSAGKDGWGVIVSEGLLNGLKAMCSNICGASWVIKDGENGVTFDWGKEGSCRSAIDRMLNDDSFADDATIRANAKASISAAAGSAYLMRILDCVYDDKKKPSIPWE